MLETLHHHFQAAAISLLTSAPSELFSFAPSAHAITEVIGTSTGGGLKDLPKKIGMVLQLRRKKFDLIVDASRGHGFIENDIRAFLIGAPIRLGFYQAGAGFLHTHGIEFQEDRNVVDKNLDLLESAGIKPKTRDLRIELPPQAVNRARQLIGHTLQDRLIITVHAGSKDVTRRWPSSEYARLIRYILGSTNALIFVLGEASERSEFEDASQSMNDERVVNCMGMTTLAESAALISMSHFFIGNDSSLLHVAIGLGIPLLAVLGPTSPQQILPSDCESNYITSCRLVIEGQTSTSCYNHEPTFFRAPCIAKPCITGLSAATVWTSLKPLLVKEHQRINR